MLLDEVKPLLIIWIPVKTSFLSFLQDTNLLSAGEQGSTWKGATDFVLRRTVQGQDSNALIVSRIPIPFYFYERLTSNKDDSDLSTGFLFDSISESIDMDYPDVPTVVEELNQEAQPKQMVRVKNTVEASFKVKNGSTIVSVLRFLLKRMLTDADMAKDLRVSFYWKEYAISHARIMDYNEAPVGNTNLTLLKLKMATYRVSDVTSETGGADKINEGDYLSKFGKTANIDTGGV